MQRKIATNPHAKHARLLINQVDRKLVKQTVMTSVYGVTYIGARDQIKRRLKERGTIADDEEMFAAACYAARVIASENHAVQWTTPLGLPVVQPYRQLGRHLIKTSLQVLTLQRELTRTAFPPNFVHSLDGSHMMTAIACNKAGLNFAGYSEKFVELYEAPILENVSTFTYKLFSELDNGSL
ncbi:hypothetical protein FNV43_RR26988 [Rhamnella rubrinervis]|uniref:DNA-directed RNA polymerase n=1 Tax=Rhamnella rubrinervis TaxID=2594499 RepID=A0A8K0GN19_9ROSA|nr:hypothetical protein FNV43_RR26988 [Rhamnella rubrinervis]